MVARLVVQLWSSMLVIIPRLGHLGILNVESEIVLDRLEQTEVLGSGWAVGSHPGDLDAEPGMVSMQGKEWGHACRGVDHVVVAELCQQQQGRPVILLVT